MKRRILSVLLTAGIIFCNISVFASYRAEKTTIDDAIRDLSDMQIVMGYEDGDFRPAAYLTKGEAAKIVCYMMGWKESDIATDVYTMSEAGEIMYGENLSAHWADKYINALSRIAVISDEKYDFNPDEYISLADVCKMLVKSLGYNEDAMVKNRSIGHIIQAMCLGLSDDLALYQDGEHPDWNINLKRGEAAVMFSKALDIPRKLMYEYSFKEGIKRKIYPDNTFRNICNKAVLFEEENITMSGERNILEFKDKTINRISDTTYLGETAIDSYALLAEENCLAIKFSEKSFWYSDYYISFDSNDDDMNYDLTFVGPFAATAIVIADLDSSKEYNIRLSTGVSAVSNQDGNVVAFTK